MKEVLDRRQILAGLILSLGAPAALAEAKGGNVLGLLATPDPESPLAFYDAADFRLISLLADAILPRTDTPGAIDAGVPHYIDKMMAAWASEATRASHRAAIRAVRLRLGEGVVQSSPVERVRAVAALDQEAYVAPVGAGSGVPGTQYRALKRLIAQVYYLSEPGATQELHYEQVPGRWLPDAPLAEIGRTWAE